MALADAARILGVTPARVYHLTWAGRIHGYESQTMTSGRWGPVQVWKKSELEARVRALGRGEHATSTGQQPVGDGRELSAAETGAS